MQRVIDRRPKFYEDYQYDKIVIPFPRMTDGLSIAVATEAGDASRFGQEGVPGIAACIDDSIDGVEQAVAEETLA